MVSHVDHFKYVHSLMFMPTVEPGYEQLLIDAVAIRDALRLSGELSSNR